MASKGGGAGRGFANGGSFQGGGGSKGGGKGGGKGPFVRTWSNTNNNNINVSTTGGNTTKQISNNNFARKNNLNVARHDDSSLEEKFNVEVVHQSNTGVVSFERSGYLFNVRGALVKCPDGSGEVSALLLYFISLDGSTFRLTYPVECYFFLEISPLHVSKFFHADELDGDVARSFEGRFQNCRASLMTRHDLTEKDHLAGGRAGMKRMIKLTFPNMESMQLASRAIVPIVASNKKYQTGAVSNLNDPMDAVIGIYEHDVQLVVRAMIDKDLRFEPVLIVIFFWKLDLFCFI